MKSGRRSLKLTPIASTSYPKQPKRIPQLDGLRGIAVLLVVFFHYFSSAAFASAVRLPASLGWTGVDLFFVMSGLLIGGIILDNQNSSNFFSVFYLRRAFRIIPLYYLLLIGGLVGILMGFDLGTMRHMLVQFGFLQNFAIAISGDLGPAWLGPTWSLAVEEHFYLLLPLLATQVPRHRLRPVLIVLIITSLLLRITVFGFDFQHAWAIAYCATPCRIDELLIGVLAADFMRQRRNRETAEISPFTLYFAMLACAILFLGITFYERPIRSIALTNTIGIWAISGFYLILLLLGVAREQNLISRITRLGALRWFGIRAYAVYLFHVPAMELTTLMSRSVDLPIATNRALALSLTIGLAALSWRMIESPLIRFSHRFQYRYSAAAPIERPLDQPANP